MPCHTLEYKPSSLEPTSDSQKSVLLSKSYIQKSDEYARRSALFSCQLACWFPGFGQKEDPVPKLQKRNSKRRKNIIYRKKKSSIHYDYVLPLSYNSCYICKHISHTKWNIYYETDII